MNAYWCGVGAANATKKRGSSPLFFYFKKWHEK